MAKLRARFAEASPAQVADDALATNTQYLGALCIFRKGRYIAGYANLQDPQTAVTQATKLAANIP